MPLYWLAKTFVKPFQVSLRRQEIADRLSAWTIFHDKHKEFCDWLAQTENKAWNRGDLSVEEMVEKLKKVRQQDFQLSDFAFVYSCLIAKACSFSKREQLAPASRGHCFRLLVGMEELQALNLVRLFRSFVSCLVFFRTAWRKSTCSVRTRAT